MVAGERGEGVTESQRNRIRTRAASRAMVISRTLITKFLGTKGRRVIACKGRNRVQFLLFSTPSLPTPLPAGCETFAVKLNNEVPLNRKKKKRRRRRRGSERFPHRWKIFPFATLAGKFPQSELRNLPALPTPPPPSPLHRPSAGASPKQQFHFSRSCYAAQQVDYTFGYLLHREIVQEIVEGSDLLAFLFFFLCNMPSSEEELGN